MGYSLGRLLDLFLKTFLIFSTVFLGVIGGIALVTRSIGELIVQVRGFVDHQPLIVNMEWSTLGNITSLINHVFPLTETLMMASAYYSMASALITLRWVKSFIPTIAN